MEQIVQKKHMYIFRNKRKAFTLIELLVVVAIIGILAAVGVVAYNGYTGAAKKAVVKSQHKEIINYINFEININHSFSLSKIIF